MDCLFMDLVLRDAPSGLLSMRSKDATSGLTLRRRDSAVSKGEARCTKIKRSVRTAETENG